MPSMAFLACSMEGTLVKQCSRYRKRHPFPPILAPMSRNMKHKNKKLSRSIQTNLESLAHRSPTLANKYGKNKISHTPSSAAIEKNHAGSTHFGELHGISLDTSPSHLASADHVLKMPLFPFSFSPSA